MDASNTPTASLNPAFLAALQDPPRRGKKARGPKRQKTPEELYAPLIKAGQVRIERRKGKPPLIVWL